MKTNLMKYLAVSMVAAALGSCSQEAVMEGASGNQNTGARTVTLQAKLGVDSRIAFDEDESSLNLLWEKDDAFSVIAGTAVQTPATFTLTEGEGTRSGKFEGEIACKEGQAIYAVWPPMTNAMSGDNQYYWSLAGQKGVLDDQYTFMVGSGMLNDKRSAEIAFTYHTAAVRMNLLMPEGVEKITKVDVLVEQYGREAAMVSIDSGGLIFDGSSREDGITIENEFTVTNGAVEVVAYFFAWEHSVLNNGKVVVTDADGSEYVGVLPSGSIRPGILYDTTVEMKADANSDFMEEADGTYTIFTSKGWSKFVSMINSGNTFEGKTVKLGADIDLKNELQTPIGLKEQVDHYSDIIFAGTLDGQNHCIKNLKIDNSVGRYTGLFAFIQGATFKNLRIASGEVKGGDKHYVGAFVGYGRGVTLINCHNEGCKVVQVGVNNSGYSGGLTGCLHRTVDESKYSFIIACTNSAEVSGTYCPSGITGGSWSGYVNVVACVNTGNISYSGSNMGTGILAAGISAALGGTNANWMYGCFVNCDIVAGSGHAALVADGGSSYQNIHYSYSANTSIQLIGAWGGNGTHNKTVGYSTYNDAVDNLNKGIQQYNWKATVPCTYQFVKGDKPTLIYAEPSKNPGSGNLNFDGGKL